MRSIRIACFALLLTSSLTTPIAAQPDLVDGFSSASKRLSVKGGVISTTTAAIIWNEWYTSKNVNEYLIMWGKDQGVFTDTLDLLPYTNFNMEEGMNNARQINSKLDIFSLSCTTGDGLEAWTDWVSKELERKRG